MTTVDRFEYEGIQYFRFGHSPLGKPSMFTYLYYIDGLLIDTGQRKAQNLVLKETSQLAVDQLFITHHHEDHSGNIQEVQQLFDCPVYSSALCSEIMKNPPSISFAQWLVWGNRPAYGGLLPIANELRTPNHHFELIPIPGHAADMLALYEPERKWLFSADLYVSSYIGYFLKNESIQEQITSLQTVLELDFQVLLCSHNPQLEGGRQKLEEKLKYLESFNDQVTDLYRQGREAPEIYKAMKLKEHGNIHLLSHGQLSKMNMVKSAIRDFNKAHS